MELVVNFIKARRWQMMGVGLGLFLMVFGLWKTWAGSTAKESVEIVKADAVLESEASQEVVVDVSGAVEKPGVYRLPDSARISEALAAAGGLAAKADRNFVSRFINLAAELSDGMKIYIPAVGEGNQSFQDSSGADRSKSTYQTQGQVAGVGVSGGININSATATELDSLWGIGQKRAADIIANRPYAAIEELMTKAGVPKNVFERIKGQISVY